MFKLNRNKAARSGENIDFRFYQIKAIQVPKGWDRLFVSILSCQTGKTIAKSSKALARNGTCQWTEDITESIWVSQDDSSKEFEDCLYKLVLATGSSRSGILGEATINVTSYVMSGITVSVSVPLKKCSFGTTLQLKIQCLTPRTDLRDDECIDTDAPLEDPNNNSPESEDRSDLSDPVTRQEQLHVREISISSSGSHHSFDENISTTLSNAGGNSYGKEQCDLPSLRNAGSSKDLIEAAEDTIEELRKESKMWERNAQKLMLDLEILREEFSGQSMKQTSLEVELSAAKAECDGLRNEVERMNLMLEKAIMEDEEQEHQKQSRAPIQNELEEEMRFHKERNDHLALQLSRSQESNIELVSVLQELEEIVEKQKVEIENLMKKDQSRFDDLERSLTLQLEENKIKVKELEESKKDLQAKYESELSAKEEEMVNLRAKLFEYTEQGHSLEADVVKEMDFLKEKLQELERDCNELTDENLDLLFKLKEIMSGSNQGASTTYELTSLDYSVKSVSSSSDHDGGEYCHDDKSKKKTIKEMDNKFDLISIKGEKPKLEEALLLKEAEIEDLRRENAELQENLQVMQRESESTLKCLSDLQNDLSVLSSSFDAHVSVNKILERKSLDLESRNFESEFHLSELDRENAQLSDWVSGLEAEIMILKDEIDLNRVEIQQKEQTLKNLETANGDLREKNLDLDSKVKEFEVCFEKCRLKVETVEESLSLLMEDFAMTDKKLSMELHKLLNENKDQEEKISELHSLVELKENEFDTTLRESMSANEKLRTSLKDLELRLTVSESERQKLAEQEIIMKIHLQKMEKFKFEKEKAEASLELVLREYRDLKDENTAFLEKISVLLNVVNELEDCRESQTALQEKVVSLEKDLMESKALCSLLSDSAHACHVVTREKFERTKSSLESELMELRERYSYLSLKYAEVEAERQELVMKMKASRSVKGWFS